MAFGQFHFSKLKPAYGGKAQVNRPVAAFLRSYQLNGGFTPGPFLLLCTVVGVLGTLLAVVLQVRQARGAGRDARAARARQLALACLLFTATAVVLLLAQDLVEFSWRYQLPAVITLPPAGILGVSALLALRRDRAEPAPARRWTNRRHRDAAAGTPAAPAQPAARRRPGARSAPQAGGAAGPAPSRARQALSLAGRSLASRAPRAGLLSAGHRQARRRQHLLRWAAGWSAPPPPGP